MAKQTKIWRKQKDLKRHTRKDSLIVEPDVHKKISAYFKDMMLETFVKNVLQEDKFKKMTGQKFDPFEKYIDKIVPAGQMPELFFSMLSIPKVGVWPKDETKTFVPSSPEGVYAYPWDEKHAKEFARNLLPWGYDRDFIAFLKIAKSAKVLHLGQNDIDNPDALVCEILNVSKSMMSELDRYLHFKMVNKERKKARTSNERFYSLLREYYFYYHAPKKITISKFNSWFRKAGFDAIYDPGLKIIYSTEPTQIVFLTPSAYELVEMLDVKYPVKSIDQAISDKSLM